MINGILCINCNSRQSGATSERRIAYTRHAVGDCDAHKSIATVERTHANACNTITDYYIRKVVTC